MYTKCIQVNFSKDQRRTSGNTLLLRPRPKSDESLFGFLVRLTEINGYEHPIWILKKAHLNTDLFKHNHGLDHRKLNLQRFFELTGLSSDDLGELVYGRAIHPFDITILGQSVPEYLLTSYRPRLCPKCLNQSPYCRKQWELKPVTSCPIHNLMLLEECPACHKPISWYRNRICLCRCGTDWRQADAPILSEKEVVVSRLIYEACGLIPRTVHITNPLYGLDLSPLVSALLLVASHEGSARPIPRNVFARQASRELHNKLLSAFSVFEGWPNGFHNFLGRVFSRHLFQTEQDLRGALARLRYRLLLFNSSQIPPPIHLSLCRELDNYVARFIPSSKCFAAKRSRKKPENGEILERQENKCFSLTVAARFLGITKQETLTLVKHSLLSGTKVQSAHKVDRWKFDENDLDAFLNNIRSRAETVRPDRTTRLWKLINLLDSLTVRLAIIGWDIHTLIEDILGGIIIPRCISSTTDLGSLYFSRLEIQDYIRVKLPQETEPLRLAYVRAGDGFKVRTFRFLARRGFIKTENAMQKGNGMLRGIKCHVIAPKEMASFKSNYVAACSLAREIGTSTSFLVQTLKTQNIYPVSGKSIDGGLQDIFRRADLIHLDLKKLMETCPRLYYGTQTIDSQAAAKMLSVPQKTIDQLVKNGVLSRYSLSPQKPGEYIFNRIYIKHFVGQFSDLTNLISAKAAAGLLQLAKTKLYSNWIERGYLQYDISRDGKKRFLIKSEVERIASFLNSIVTRPEAAIILGVPWGRLNTVMRREGLSPVQNPYPRAFRFVVYSRTDIEKLKSNMHAPELPDEKALVRLSFRKRNFVLAPHSR